MAGALLLLVSLLVGVPVFAGFHTLVKIRSVNVVSTSYASLLLAFSDVPDVFVLLSPLLFTVCSEVLSVNLPGVSAMASPTALNIPSSDVSKVCGISSVVGIPCCRLSVVLLSGCC